MLANFALNFNKSAPKPGFGYFIYLMYIYRSSMCAEMNEHANKIKKRFCQLQNLHLQSFIIMTDKNHIAWFVPLAFGRSQIGHKAWTWRLQRG